MKNIKATITLAISVLFIVGCQQKKINNSTASFVAHGENKADLTMRQINCYGIPLRKAVIYGDSISTGTHGKGGYEAKLKQSLQLAQIYNYSIGSSGLSTSTPDSMVALIKKDDKIPADADLVIIWHGTNDWYWGTQIGREGDTALNTFWGGIDYVVTRLRKKLPDARIVWGTPLYRWQAPHLTQRSGEAYALPNAVGYTLLDYANALEAASKRYGFNLIDFGRLTNIHKENESRYLEDRVHPNAEGYEVIHRIFYHEIQQICGL